MDIMACGEMAPHRLSAYRFLAALIPRESLDSSPHHPRPASSSFSSSSSCPAASLNVKHFKSRNRSIRQLRFESMFLIDINRICYSFTGSSLLSSRNFTHPTLFPHFLKTLCQEFSYNLAIPKISFLTSIKRLLILQSPANSSSILLVHRPTGASPLSPPPIIKVRKRNSDISITFVWKRGAPPLSLSLPRSRTRS